MTLSIVPWGGLCNRMRAVASAWNLAQVAGQPMQVLWYRAPDFNAPFHSLFERDTCPWTVEERDAMHPVQKARIRIEEFLLRLRGSRVYTPELTEKDVFNVEGFNKALESADVYVRTHSAVGPANKSLEYFKPTGQVKRSLDRLLPSIGDAVAVHIRRSDNAKSTAMSPLTQFVKLMADEVDADAAARFFVASDSVEDVEALRKQFGARILTYEKRSYDRQDHRAIEDAVVDLYALASCRKLIGSYWSSFTDTAHAIHGIPYVIATQSS